RSAVEAEKHDEKRKRQNEDELAPVLARVVEQDIQRRAGDEPGQQHAADKAEGIGDKIEKILDLVLLFHEADLRKVVLAGSALAGRPPQKAQVGGEVAAEQAAGVLQQAVEPLEVVALHPGRRAADVARLIVERRADAEHQRID